MTRRTRLMSTDTSTMCCLSLMRGTGRALSMHFRDVSLHCDTNTCLPRLSKLLYIVTFPYCNSALFAWCTIQFSCVRSASLDAPRKAQNDGIMTQTPSTDASRTAWRGAHQHSLPYHHHVCRKHLISKGRVVDEGRRVAQGGRAARARDLGGGRRVRRVCSNGCVKACDLPLLAQADWRNGVC